MNARCPCCGAPVIEGRARAAAIVGRMTFRNQQARILACLMRDFGRAVDTATILDAVYADHRDGGPLGAARSVAVAVVALRRRLKPFGLVIDGVARNGRTLRFADAPEGEVAPGRYVGLVRHVDADGDAPAGRRQAA